MGLAMLTHIAEGILAPSGSVGERVSARVGAKGLEGTVPRVALGGTVRGGVAEGVGFRALSPEAFTWREVQAITLDVSLEAGPFNARATGIAVGVGSCGNGRGQKEDREKCSSLGELHFCVGGLVVVVGG